MKLNNKETPFLLLILLIVLPLMEVFAQEKSEVEEPPIPVYIVCPYHEDSLKAAFSGTGSADGSAFNQVIKKCDSLELQIIRSGAENTAYFTWLYTLVALLGAMIIVILFSTAKIRKEIAQLKRIEHLNKLSSPEIFTQPEHLQSEQEPLSIPEPKEVQPPIKRRTVKTKKTH